MTANTHFVISGNQVTSEHPDKDAASAAAVTQAKQGRTVRVLQLLETVAPNTGVVITDAAGNSQTVK